MIKEHTSPLLIIQNNANHVTFQSFRCCPRINPMNCFINVFQLCVCNIEKIHFTPEGSAHQRNNSLNINTMVLCIAALEFINSITIHLSFIIGPKTWLRGSTRGMESAGEDQRRANSHYRSTSATLISLALGLISAFVYHVSNTLIGLLCTRRLTTSLSLLIMLNRWGQDLLRLFTTKPKSFLKHLFDAFLCDNEFYASNPRRMLFRSTVKIFLPGFRNLVLQFTKVWQHLCTMWHPKRAETGQANSLKFSLFQQQQKKNTYTQTYQSQNH